MDDLVEGGRHGGELGQPMHHRKIHRVDPHFYFSFREVMEKEFF
jgi:hypothetical protein